MAIVDVLTGVVSVGALCCVVLAADLLRQLIENHRATHKKRTKSDEFVK